jgi:hypothetical protein
MKVRTGNKRVLSNVSGGVAMAMGMSRAQKQRLRKRQTLYTKGQIGSF